MTIVKARLVSVPGVCHARAIELAARKVSSVNGDVRRALEVLRRAAELAEFELDAAAAAVAALATGGDVAGTGTHLVQAASGVPAQGGGGDSAALVTTSHVTRVFQEMFNAVHIQVSDHTVCFCRCIS